MRGSGGEGRVAPLGPGSASVVVATFFNFSPAAVAVAIPGCRVVRRPTAKGRCAVV